MSKSNKQHLGLSNIIIILCLVPLIFLGASSFYIFKLDNILREDLKNSLEDAGADAATAALLRMQSSIIRLEGIAAHPLIADKDIALSIKLDIARKNAKKYGWQDILIADADGATRSSSGNTMNVSRRYYFYKAMQGLPFYSTILNSPLYDVPIIAHAVPLKYNDVIVGALIAIEEATLAHFTIDDIASSRKDIITKFMDETGVILSDRKILNVNFYAKVAEENNITLEQVKDLFNHNKHAEQSLIYDGQPSYLVLTPIGSSGWNAITIIEEQAALGTVHNILYLSIGVVVVMISLLVACLYYLFNMQKTYKHHSNIARTALLVDSIFYVSIDYNAKILYANESLGQNLGLVEEKNYVLTNFFENIQIEALHILIQANQAFVLPILGKNGNKIYVQWNVMTSNQKDNWTLLGIDVSAHHHKVEAQLAKNHNDDLQQIIDNLPTPIMMHDLDGKILMANSSAKQVVGTSNLPEIYETLKKGLGDEAFAGQLNCIKKVAATCQRETHTLSYTAQNGEIFTFQSVQNPLFHDNGVVRATVSLSTDITATLDLQKKLEDEISRLQAILENCPAGVFFSSNNIVQYCNPTAHNMLGIYSGGPIPQKNLIVEGDMDALRTQIANGIDTHNAPFTINDPQGNVHNVLVTAIHVTWREERLNVIWMLDVTEMHTIQKELMEAKDVAELATRAKGDFLATMSHEIRTPMNAILGFLHLFDKKNLSSKQTSYIEKITISATGLLRIINDILDFSKIEANKMDLEFSPFNLEASIDAIYSIMSFTANEKGLELTKYFDSNVPKVIVGDRERLNQVLLNLLGNAIKFTHKGSVSLNVLAQELHEDKVKLQFTVSDTGIGLSKDQASRLFQPFTQADTSTSRRFGGTGLGLVISSRLIELMGGSISLESKLGEGSTFTCSIEAKIDNSIDVDNINIDSSGELFGAEAYDNVDTSFMKGRRVLLVEDNMINQEIASALLEEYEFELDLANNGEEAVSKVRENTYDLILMDVQMPIMDGLQATSHIRAMANNTNGLKDLPIIAMTANVLDEDKRRCAAAGMNAHVAKPISPHELRNALIQWFS